MSDQLNDLNQFEPPDLGSTLSFSVALEYANEYFSHRVSAGIWNSATPMTRKNALQQAIRLISAAFVFEREAFQRSENGEIIWRDRVMAAVSEEALWILSKDPTSYPDLLALGISSGTVGPLSATFDKTFIAPLICDASVRLIGRLGTLDDGAFTCKSTPLQY